MLNIRMAKSNYEMVKEFHDAFGQAAPDTMQCNITKENAELCKFRISLIEEEYTEFKDAIKADDFTEIRDALADLLYVVYGTAVAFGIKSDDDFKIIHDSNMSKLCDTEEDAILTVNAYKKQIEEGTCKYNEPVYIYRDDIKKYIVKDSKTGKVLKNIKYRPVKLD